jgi:hypothetical protein
MKVGDRVFVLMELDGTTQRLCGTVVGRLSPSQVVVSVNGRRVTPFASQVHPVEKESATR